MEASSARALAGIVDRAVERIASVPEVADRPQQVEALRGYLRIETERLRMRHRVGLSGDDVTSGRSQQVDLAVRRICQLAAAEFGVAAQRDLAGAALVALGGYGRAELAPFSDVDLLFLRDEAAPAVVREFVERVLALLWDTGFTVGHSFRTVRECVAIAREDLHSRTALAESRLVAGNAALLAQLGERLDDAVFRDRGQTEAFLAALRAETDARFEKYGRVVGLLEPNVKHGAGGLRDLHTLLWLGHARFGTRGLEPLKDAGQLSEAEYVALRRARGFLSRVRNEAHFSSGREVDQLTLELQPDVAANLGYTARRGEAASERLMHDYYSRAREMHGVFESFAARNGLYVRPRRALLRLPLRGRHRRLELHAGLVHQRAGRGGFEGGATAVMEIFDWAQQRNAGLSDETKVAVRAAVGVVDDKFRRSREAARVFLGLLARRGRVAPTLRAMHATDFLGRYLPEFGRITFRVQHDHYHRYTVDEHTLRAIDALDEVALSKARDGDLGMLRVVLDEVADATPLYLALLLHDTGKGRRGSHVPAGVRLAERVCARMHLASGTAEDVVFLVRSHLAMSQLSQRRDLSEESLIRTFAAKVGSPERLRLLFLLTYADHRAVAPGIWNGWKAALLWELYERTLRVLAPDASPVRGGDAHTRARVRVLSALSGEFPASVVERHIAMLPERYLRSTNATAVGSHLGLIRGLEEDSLRVAWSAGEEQDHSELTVCTRDAAGLFARLAGMLAVHNLNILAVDAYTREDGVVLDSFRVCESPGCRVVGLDRRDRIEAALREALTGARDVGSAVEAWRRERLRRSPRRRSGPRAGATVRLDDEVSPTSTIVEVGAEDELGLAYRIASTLSRVGLSIVFAKIASEKSRAWDVFYVTEREGGKLTAERKHSVERALLDELSGAVAVTIGEGVR